MAKSRLLWTVGIAALVMLPTASVFAQDLTGTWQGTVQDPGQERRLVIKVTTDGTALRAVLYSIDRGPQPYAGTLTHTGTAVKMLIPSIDGTYWTPDPSQFAALGGVPPSVKSDDPNAPPGLFTAIQEQLGLKLDSTKAPVDVFVIDHVDHPTPD